MELEYKIDYEDSEINQYIEKAEDSCDIVTVRLFQYQYCPFSAEKATQDLIATYGMTRIGSSFSLKVNHSLSWDKILANLKSFSKNHPLCLFFLEQVPDEYTRPQMLSRAYIYKGKSQEVDAVVTVTFPQFDPKHFQ